MRHFHNADINFKTKYLWQEIIGQCLSFFRCQSNYSPLDLINSKNVVTSRPLFVYFLSFQTSLKFLQQRNVKNDPPSMRHWDSNPQPFGLEAPSVTTRPGLCQHFVNQNTQFAQMSVYYFTYSVVNKFIMFPTCVCHLPTINYFSLPEPTTCQKNQ